MDFCAVVQKHKIKMQILFEQRGWPHGSETPSGTAFSEKLSSVAEVVLKFDSHYKRKKDELSILESGCHSDNIYIHLPVNKYH